MTANAALNIRTFRPEDEAAVVNLWQRCALVVLWNDPHKDIATVIGLGKRLA